MDCAAFYAAAPAGGRAESGSALSSAAPGGAFRDLFLLPGPAPLRPAAAGQFRDAERATNIACAT